MSEQSSVGDEIYALLPDPTNTCDSWFITTPYVDAYETAQRYDHGSRSLVTDTVTWERFSTLMTIQAHQWGAMSVGERVLLNLPTALHDERFVLSFGYWGERTFLGVAQQGSDWRIDIVEVDSIPDDWEVT